MIQQINLNDLQQVNDELFSFVWNFKHGDNIMYNFKILQTLYIARETAENERLLNKPITIQIVSIVEAILIDFLTRIDLATNHLPGGVDRETLDEIKAEIEKDKKPHKIEDEFGERIFMRRKMYHFNQIVKILRKYEILGTENDDIYGHLSNFADMRNRVHIENYHGNLEDREYKVFTSQRLNALEEVLSGLWVKMTTDFKRPWEGSV